MAHLTIYPYVADSKKVLYGDINEYYYEIEGIEYEQKDGKYEISFVIRYNGGKPVKRAGTLRMSEKELSDMLWKLPGKQVMA